MGVVAGAEHNTNSNCVEASRDSLPKIRLVAPGSAGHVAVCSGSI